MKLPNNPKVLAATYNPVSKTKMFSVMVDFPTSLLAELRTHRVITQGAAYEHCELIDLSLSANSARAIPTSKYLQKVLDNPFIPIWTKKQAGMSGKVIDNPDTIEEAEDTWLFSLDSKGATINDYTGTRREIDSLAQHYTFLINRGVHKQNANRLLAPFAYTTCILSGTQWENFFSLRCPKYTLVNHSPQKEVKVYNSREKLKLDFGSELYQCMSESGLKGEEFWQSINKSEAQIEFQIISEMIYDLYQEADWKQSKYHIPFESEIKESYSNQVEKYILNNQPHLGYNAEQVYDKIQECYMMISASKSAKLSYDTQEKPDTLEKHLTRAQHLLDNKHSEPFSHQAVAMNHEEMMFFSKTRIVSNTKLNSLADNETLYHPYTQDSKQSVVREKGVCYNNRGFITQRYIIENL